MKIQDEYLPKVSIIKEKTEKIDQIIFFNSGDQNQFQKVKKEQENQKRLFEMYQPVDYFMCKRSTRKRKDHGKETYKKR